MQKLLRTAEREEIESVLLAMHRALTLSRTIEQATNCAQNVLRAPHFTRVFVECLAQPAADCTTVEARQLPVKCF